MKKRIGRYLSLSFLILLSACNKISEPLIGSESSCRIIKLCEGLSKFMRVSREGLALFLDRFMRVVREGQT